VRRLTRVAVGPVALGELGPGEGREISSSERDLLLAALAGRGAGAASKPSGISSSGGERPGSGSGKKWRRDSRR
jgi:hypothetical protein